MKGRLLEAGLGGQRCKGKGAFIFSRGGIFVEMGGRTKKGKHQRLVEKGRRHLLEAILASSS